jgi:hypothetical protein
VRAGYRLAGRTLREADVSGTTGALVLALRGRDGTFPANPPTQNPGRRRVRADRDRHPAATSRPAASRGSSRLTPGTAPRRSTAAALRRCRAVAGAARRGHVTAMVGNVCSGRGSGGDGGCVPVGAAAHRSGVLQQQERHVIVGVTAGVPVHGSDQGLQCLIAVRCEKRRCDRVFREEVPAGVAAFDEPVGVEQQPVAGRPGRGESGVIIGKAERQLGLPAGQRPQVAAVPQQRRVSRSKIGSGSWPAVSSWRQAARLYSLISPFSMDFRRIRWTSRFTAVTPGTSHSQPGTCWAMP